LLTWAVTGREVPYGHTPEDVGVLVVELPTLAALAAMAEQSAPMTHRVVTVTGPSARRPGHYRIPVGTAFADIIRHVGAQRPIARVVDGGPLTGQSVESLDAVLTKQTRAILLLDRDSDRIPSPGPCVRCGWCQEDCPVGLDPQALLDRMERDRLTEAAGLYPHACTECGVCSYVCPAELPLAEAVGRLKQLVPP
jgi:electron transport complex protein RnfC